MTPTLTPVPETARIPDTSNRADAPVEVTTEVAGAEWDAYVRAHPHGTVDHLWAWRAIFDGVFGHQCRYLAARRGGQIAGVLPLVLMRSRLFGRLIVSVPVLNDGGLLTDDDGAAASLLGTATSVATEFGARHVELRHRARQRPELPSRQHKLGLTLPLSTTPDDLWKRIDRKVRNQVRKAQKSGLEVVEGGVELLDAFYPIFAENMRDLGTPVYPRRLFAETLRVFGPQARIWLARQGTVPMAGAVTIRFGETVVNPWASSLRRFRALCPNVLLYWGMLEAAAATGAAAFDFGRSSPGGGTHQFKLQWGAVETPLHWEYVLLQSSVLPDTSPTNAKMHLAVEAWKRLPLAVANVVGPHLSRHLP